MALAVLPRLMIVDTNGVPRVAAKLYFYQATTVTPITVYTTGAYSVSQANPVASLSNGFFPAVYINPVVNSTYKIVVKDPSDVTIWTEDNVPALGFSASDIGFTANDIGLIIYPLTAAETAAAVTPTTYAFPAGDVRRYGAVGDGVTSDFTAFTNAIAQSSQAGGARVTTQPAKTYSMGASTLVMLNDSSMDISGSTIKTTNATVLTFGTGSTLFGYNGSILQSSGAAGTAVKKTNTASPGSWYIYGWVKITPTALGTVGGIGLDITAAYKGVFEIYIEGYETNFIAGAGTDVPQTYYNEIRSPRIVCTSGTTGMKFQRGCNGTTVINVQLSGALVATKGVWCVGAGGIGPGTLDFFGGYIEGFADTAAVRGLQLDDTFNFTATGVTFDSVSVTANFAIGATGTSTQCNFYGCGFASGWGDSTKIMTWTASGVFNFIGGAPTNQLNILGKTTFLASELNGTIRAGRFFGGAITCSDGVASDYTYKLTGTADGQGLYLSNNSASKLAGRSVVSLDRKGGSGYGIDFLNNGSAAGGIAWGAGSPETVVTAVIGAIYLRTDGGAATTLYVKETGVGNTGWAAK